MKLVAVDSETTGLEPGSRLLSLAGIAFDGDTGDVIERRAWTINPGMPIPPDAAAVNGHTDEELADSPDAGTVLRKFFDWLPPGAPLIAHNAPYDTGVISWDAARCGVQIPDGLLVIDTCATARGVGATRRNSLDALVDHYGIQRCGEGHRAMSDADACMQYWMRVRQTEQFAYELHPWGAGHDYSYTDVLPVRVCALPVLVSRGEDSSFTYKDAKGDVTERTITPYGWAMTASGLMFHGLCHLRGERRTFRADRLFEQSAEPKDDET